MILPIETQAKGMLALSLQEELGGNSWKAWGPWFPGLFLRVSSLAQALEGSIVKRMNLEMSLA